MRLGPFCGPGLSPIAPLARALIILLVFSYLRPCPRSVHESWASDLLYHSKTPCFNCALFIFLSYSFKKTWTKVLMTRIFTIRYLIEGRLASRCNLWEYNFFKYATIYIYIVYSLFWSPHMEISFDKLRWCIELNLRNYDVALRKRKKRTQISFLLADVQH